MSSRHIKLVPTNTSYEDSADLLQESAESRPRVLIVTSQPDRFSDLPAIVDFASDHLEAVATAITLRNELSFIIADTTLTHSRDSGCKLASNLRTHNRIKVPIYLVSDNPLPSDRHYAMQHGATDLLLRDRRVLAAILRGEAVRSAARSARLEPSWLLEIITALREFIASEAEPRVRNIYTSLQTRFVDTSVEHQDVVSEASLLLDDLDDRRAFLRLAGAKRI